MSRDQREESGLGPWSYQGKRLEWVHYRCPCGEMTTIEIPTGIDAQEDPELALSAVEEQGSSDMHSFRCDECQGECRIQLSWTYFNGAEELFVLVLPEAARHRELEERAELLRKLAACSESLPPFVVEFQTVFGRRGLGELLRGRRRKSEERRQELERETRFAELEREARERDDELRAREEELEREMQDLDARSAKLTEMELGLRDRKGALDRRSAELEKQSEAIEEAKAQIRAESQGELPKLLTQNDTQVIEPEEVLTSAPKVHRGDEDPAETLVATSGSTGPSKADPADTAPSIESDGSPESHAPAAVLPPYEESFEDSLDEDSLTTQPRPSLPEKRALDAHVQAWRDSKSPNAKVLDGQSVRLMAEVGPVFVEELGAKDLRALLQLHRMRSYPLVVLSLGRAGTLGGQKGAPYSFFFDVMKKEDRAVLDRLSQDFRVQLEVYDAEDELLLKRRLKAPLESNVRYVVAAAQDACESMGASMSFDAAVGQYLSDEYDRFFARHPLASEFKERTLEKLERARDVWRALQMARRFASPEGEEYLVAQRSYPLDRWHRRRVEIVGRALAMGLWMGPELARLALSEELVGGPKELVQRCKKNFDEWLGGGAPGLDKTQIEENHREIRGEAQRLGLASGPSSAPIRSSEGDKASAASGVIGMNKTLLGAGVIQPGAKHAPLRRENDLLQDLEQPRYRLQAIVELCQRNEIGSVEPIFRALAELPVHEASEGFAAATWLGARACEDLLVLLNCPSGYLQHGAAMALCALGNPEGIDTVCDLLMESSSPIWQEYAYCLGMVGRSAIMPIVARISANGAIGEERAMWSLAYASTSSGKDALKTLASGRNQVVAKVARSAMELGARIARGGRLQDGRAPQEKSYTDAFFQVLRNEATGYAGNELSGPAMLLDDADLIEADEMDLQS